MARLLNSAGLVIGAAAIILQFMLTIPSSMALGRSLFGSIVFFFSFFTILTNILAVLVHWAALFGKPSFFARPVVRAGVAIAITVVALVYWVLLSSTWAPQGLFLLCDILLHYVTPGIFIIWWLSIGADGSLIWRHIPLWLLYPLGYVAYVMLRAPIAGEVPYPFLDAALNGWGGVIVTVVGIALVFILFGAIAVLFDKTVGKARNSKRI